MARPTWGDTVRIKNTAPREMQPGHLAAVCGIRQIENEDHVSQFGCAIGTGPPKGPFRDDVVARRRAPSTKSQARIREASPSRPQAASLSRIAPSISSEWPRT